MNQSELITNEEISVANTSPGKGIAIDEAIANYNYIKEAQKQFLDKGTDYTNVPGIESTILTKSGAEKLASLYTLVPKYKTKEIQLPNGHLRIKVKCQLFHRQTGLFWGEGVGQNTTMEKKYRWRSANISCPMCGGETIRRDKSTGGHYCWQKIGGCGENYQNGDGRIKPAVGMVENPDIADTYHTVELMATKRAFVAAVRTALGISGIFTQDLDEREHDGDTPPQQRPQPRAQNNNLQSPPKITKRVNIPQEPQSVNGDAVVMEKLNEAFRGLNESLSNAGQKPEQSIIKAFFQSLNDHQFSECDKILAGMKLSLESTMEVK